jgi:hypothetical protein
MVSCISTDAVLKEFPSSPAVAWALPDVVSTLSAAAVAVAAASGATDGVFDGACVSLLTRLSPCFLPFATNLMLRQAGSS